MSVPETSSAVGLLLLLLRRLIRLLSLLLIAGRGGATVINRVLDLLPSIVHGGAVATQALDFPMMHNINNKKT